MLVKARSLFSGEGFHAFRVGKRAEPDRRRNLDQVSSDTVELGAY